MRPGCATLPKSRELRGPARDHGKRGLIVLINAVPALIFVRRIPDERIIGAPEAAVRRAGPGLSRPGPEVDARDRGAGLSKLVNGLEYLAVIPVTDQRR